MADVTLFTPGRIDGFDTKNRLVMAPMTRSRALPGGVPSELAIEYYTQRASAGLIITEGVAPCAAGHVEHRPAFDERCPAQHPFGRSFSRMHGRSSRLPP